MKLLCSILCLTLFIWSCTGCEKHRLEELRRQRAEQRLRDMAQQSLKRERERAYDDIRESIYRENPDDRYIEHVHSSYESNTAPPGNKFCDPNNEYFCPTDTECILSSDGSYKCWFGGKVKVTRERYVPQTRPILPHVRRTRVLYPTHTGGNTYHPSTSSERRYPSTGEGPYYPSPPDSSRYGSSGGSIHYPYTSRGSRFSIPSNSRRHPPYIRRTSTRICPDGTKRINITETSFRCEDINECTEEPGRCGDNAICVNSYKTHICRCEHGYEMNADQECVDIDECDKSSRRRCSQVCINTPGSYDCECAPGHRELSYKRCEDIDECESNPCASDEVCFNYWGGYNCTDPEPCPDGYQRSKDSENPNGPCILQNTSLANYDTPNSIKFKKMVVTAVKRTTLRELGVMTFTAAPTASHDGSVEYHHNFRARLVKGGEYFRIHSLRMYNGIRLSFYNRRPLPADVPIDVELLITDTATPTRYSFNRFSSYYSEPRSMTSYQKIMLTVIPMDHGNMDDVSSSERRFS